MKPVGLLLAAGASIQFGAAFAVTLFDRVGAGGAVFLRLLFAAAMLLVVFRPRFEGRAPADVRLAVVFGVVLGLMNWSFYEALERIPLGACVTIEFLGPLGVAVWGSRRASDVLWVVLAAVGIAILADPFGGGALDPAGAGLALVAGAFWASYIVLSARTGRVWPGASGLAVAMAVAALVALPAGLAQGGAELLALGMLGSGAVVALASSVVPYSLEMEALRRLPQGVFGVLMSLEPALAALAGFLVLGQALASAELLGIGFVVVACAGAARGAAGRMAPTLEPP